MHQFGARSFDFDLDTGEATLLPPAGKPLEPDTLSKVIANSGFELLGLELELVGELLEVSLPGGDPQPALELANTGQRFALTPGASEPGRAAWGQLSPEFSPELAGSGRQVWVRGRVNRQAAGMPALEVSDVHFVEN